MCCRASFYLNLNYALFFMVSLYQTDSRTQVAEITVENFKRISHTGCSNPHFLKVMFSYLEKL